MKKINGMEVNNYITREEYDKLSKYHHLLYVPKSHKSSVFVALPIMGREYWE